MTAEGLRGVPAPSVGSAPGLDPSSADASGRGAHGLLANRAYLLVRDQLIMLRIPPGEVIHESRLGAELGIGRTPIREALKRLEREHLVVSYPRRGTFATTVDIADLVDINEMRLALEPVAAARAAVAATPDLRRLMADKIDELNVSDIPSNWRDLIAFDLEVHRLIYRSGGNPHLEETLVRLDNLATRIWCLYLERLPTVAEHVLEHVGLLQAIHDRRAEQAADLARAHVRHFDASIRQLL